MKEIKKAFEGVYYVSGKPATKALVGKPVYGEEIIEGYRIWNPYRSKLAACISKGLRAMPIKADSKVLYLGASTGTTASHISDIVVRGHIYALEFSETSMRKLLNTAKERDNMTPLLQDARRPNDYQYLIGDVTGIYQDVAQKDQCEILIRNAREFLSKGDFAVICIKARSIDTAGDPKKIYGMQREILKDAFTIVQEIDPSPYDKDHRIFFLEFKGA